MLLTCLAERLQDWSDNKHFYSIHSDTPRSNLFSDIMIGSALRPQKRVGHWLARHSPKLPTILVSARKTLFGINGDIERYAFLPTKYASRRIHSSITPKWCHVPGKSSQAEDPCIEHNVVQYFWIAAMGFLLRDGRCMSDPSLFRSHAFVACYMRLSENEGWMIYW